MANDRNGVDFDFLSKHEQNVRPWLDLVDALRAQGVHEELNLPQIAVMGDQSSGKSSVLEALSGVPFPRGSGLVTRCPTQISMKKGPAGTQWKATASILQFNGKPATAKTVHSPLELSGLITELTEQLTEGGGTFSHDVIAIQVVSPDVPDLTLIDLPGIVRTTTSGQDHTVVGRVNDLIESYLVQDRTIILAVIPANQDVATVDILERAAQVDPKGERTIGVITKPDLVGPGSENEVVQVVTNKRKPLKLGYVMIKNRTQKELENHMSLVEAKRVEKDYFASHDVWSRMPPQILGIGNLTARLMDLLVTRIKNVLPAMKFELQEMQAKVTRDLKLLGREAPTKPYDRMNVLMKLVAEYSSVLRNAVRGDYRDMKLAEHPQLRLRTLLDQTFRGLSDRIRETKPDFDAKDFSTALEREIRGLRGRELPGLVNSYFFYTFMVTKIEDWREPVDSAKQELFDMIIAVSTSIFALLCPQYPEIGKLVSTVLQEWAEIMLLKVDTRVNEVFKQEEDPFVANDDLAREIVKVRLERFDKALNFVLKDTDNKAESTLGSAPSPKMLEDDMKDKLGQWYMANHGANSASLIEDMRTVLIAYWQLSSKRLTENVCMSFEAHVLARLSEDVESELLTAVQTKGDDLVKLLFTEPTHVVEERAQLKVRKQRFDTAMATLNRLAPDVVAVSRRRKPTRAAMMGHPMQRPNRPTPPPAPQRQPAAANGGQAAQPQGQPEVQDDAIAVFEFSGNHGDNGGYIYWLGTEGRSKKFENPHDRNRLRVTSSGMAVGNESDVVSRKRKEVVVSSGNDVWLCIDFGRSRLFSPSHYTLCHGSQFKDYDISNWALEGHDAAKNVWVNLNDSTGPQLYLKSGHGVGTWPVDVKGTRFRYLRLRSLAPNQRGDNSLPYLCL